MKRHIIYRITLLAFAGIALAASLLIQGCGQSDNDQNFITGPSFNSVEQPSAGDALSAQPGRTGELPGQLNAPAPDPVCQINHTAEVVFVNFSRVITYGIVVNGKDRGYLEPEANMLLTVPAGEVKWHVFRKGNEKPLHYGIFAAKQCGRYRVDIDFDPTEQPAVDPAW